MIHSFSNVRVVSNVYPITTAATFQLPGLPERIAAGLSMILSFGETFWCKRSLKKLSDLKGGGVIDDRQRIQILLAYDLVNRAQIDACWERRILR